MPRVRAGTARRTRSRTRLRPLLACAAALGLAPGASGATGGSGAPRSRSAQPEVPPGVTAGVAVFDRETGTFTERSGEDLAFRSASVVKLLIVLDFLWDRGPDYEIPAADRARLAGMLRRSDDEAASHYWARRGGSAVVARMVPRLGLTGTAPPPESHPGYWGYTTITAADTVRIYRYVLDSAPAPVREFVRGELHRATRCAADGYDQFFGIASAFERPWSLKQGWSGFDSGGCTAADRAASAAGDVDLVSGALHSTGTVGADDRSIVAVLTLHPEGTSYGTASSRLTRLVGSLDVPGAVRPSGTRFATWGSGVRVRAAATTDSSVVTTLPAGVEVLVGCQRRGQLVEVPPYANDWWAYLPQYGGYLTNVYVDVAERKLPGVPDCPG